MASDVTLNPDVLRWARERAGLDTTTLARKIGVREERVLTWETSGTLTFVQAEKLAYHTNTPIGHLFLPRPLQDQLPIPDFRTVGDHALKTPSPDLLETVQTMQNRQSWMRDYLIESGQSPLPFIGRFKDGNIQPRAVAADILKILGLASNWASGERSWTDALVKLRHCIDAAGILIFINGVVGNNTSRKLDPEEFRGFALCDSHAPLIFINGADAKAAQMFTMAHELAHLWLGQDGISDLGLIMPGSNKIEQLCNRVAAEFLVPESSLRSCWQEAARADNPYQYLSRRFKVSTLVLARRALDLGLISLEQFHVFYRDWQAEAGREQKTAKSGGDFWNTQIVRVGERFGRAVIRSAKEEKLLYRDAFRLIGMSGGTFDKFAQKLGFDNL